MKYIALIFLFLIGLHQNRILGQTSIPTIGDGYTEIANWNLDWLGNTGAGFGPSNDALQQANIKDVLAASDIDIWAFCEIYNRTVFDSIFKSLPQYAYEIANFSASQKTALAWKSSQFAKLYSRNILANFDYSFGGRTPFEISLLDKYNGDTVTFIVIHGKANTGTSTDKLTSYNRRKDGATYLKKYLDSYPTKKMMLLGDFNDDLDTSIFDNLETPYKNFVLDTVNYFFPTLKLTKTNQKSTVSYSSMIDHQLISKSMYFNYIPNSSKVFVLSNYINNYGSTTSDHYPVYSRFTFVHPIYSIKQQQNQIALIYPNPTQCQSSIKCSIDMKLIKIRSISGIELFKLEKLKNTKFIDLPRMESGIYLLEITFSNSKKQTIKWIVE